MQSDQDTNYMKLTGLPSAFVWYQVSPPGMENKQWEKQKDTGDMLINVEISKRVQIS